MVDSMTYYQFFLKILEYYVTILKSLLKKINLKLNHEYIMLICTDIGICVRCPFSYTDKKIFNQVSYHHFPRHLRTSSCPYSFLKLKVMYKNINTCYFKQDICQLASLCRYFLKIDDFVYYVLLTT